MSESAQSSKLTSMKKFFLATAAISTLLVLVIAGGFNLYKSSFFFLKNISYEYSADKNSSAYIETLKPTVENELRAYLGMSLWKIDIFKIEKSLQSKKWIQNVSVSRVFPNEISVHIESKKIIANILKSPSQLQPVSDDATVMDAVDIGKSPVAPILSHPIFIHDKALRESALEFLKELPQDGSFSFKNISEILPLKRSAQSNPSFKIILKNSKAEVLIDNENVPIKAARVSRVIDYLGDKDMEDRIIDANFSKKVLVRLRNHR